MRWRVLGWLLLGGLAGPAAAGDGVVEINQSCAMTGCFAGDDPDFPVTITGAAGQSYVLTSDLNVAQADRNGIEISGSGVHLDLNGFTLAGPVVCMGLGSGVTCDPGTGVGIRNPGPTEGSVVRNGQVTGFGGKGVETGERSLIERVTALANGGTGLSASIGSRIVNSQALRNGGGGINSPGLSVIEGNVARQNAGTGISFGAVIRGNATSGNGSHGISMGGGLAESNSIASNQGHGIHLAGSSPVIARNNELLANQGDGVHAGTVGRALLIEGNSIALGTGDGIDAGDDATIRGNSVYENNGQGIRCGTGCTVADNTVNDNGTASVGDGIEVDSGANVYGNTVRGHPEFGLRGLNTTFGYRDNVFTDNNGGNANFQVTLNGADLGGNICGNPISCLD